MTETLQGITVATDRRARVAIRATGVQRVYRKKSSAVSAVDDLDLVVGRGEFVSIVGPSGCGKSTLLRMIDGLIRPTAGEIELYHSGETDVLSATVFQEYSIFPWRTVLGNVSIGLRARGVPRRVADAHSREWIERVGLGGFEDAYPASLSGGMKQRVALARALVMDSDVLLMDEPFAALDAQLRKVLGEDLLRICQATDKTVVFVTHSLEEAILLSDRIILMTRRPGRVKATFDVPFQRPRDANLRGSAAFAALEEQIWEQLRHEVDASAEEAFDG
jgi:NitT/TauT family transport system ATP-binding protein